MLFNIHRKLVRRRRKTRNVVALVRQSQINLNINYCSMRASAPLRTRVLLNIRQ